MTAVAVVEYVILRTTEAGVKFGINKVKNNRRNLNINEEAYYTVNKCGVSNERVYFNIGDKVRVLEVDRDAVLIEISGNDDNPYFASKKFLKTISNYV